MKLKSETVNEKLEQMLAADYSGNPYYTDNPDNFKALIKLFCENRTQYYHSLTAHGSGYRCKLKPYKPRPEPKYRYLGIWIDGLLPMLDDPVIRMSTKVKWILEGRTSFPKCAVCGKDDYYRTYNVSFGYDYPRTCSIVCQNNDPVRNDNLKLNNRLKYGYDWPKQNPEIQRRDKARLMELSGVSNVFQLESVKIKSKLTNERNHGDCNWRNVEQILATRATFTDEKKEEILEKTRQTCFKNFGVCSPFQSDVLKKKSALTYYNATGYWHPAQNPEVLARSAHRYSFGDLKFDSSHELAFFIYASDNMLGIERANISIPYSFNGKTRYYFPDFIHASTGKLIEVKGAHFFDKDGKMICPYRYKDWTDDQYVDRCAREEAKHQCMLENNVHIIRTDSICMRTIMLYVTKKYSATYIESFRNKADV